MDWHISTTEPEYKLDECPKKLNHDLKLFNLLQMFVFVVNKDKLVRVLS